MARKPAMRGTETGPWLSTGPKSGPPLQENKAQIRSFKPGSGHAQGWLRWPQGGSLGHSHTSGRAQACLLIAQVTVMYPQVSKQKWTLVRLRFRSDHCGKKDEMKVIFTYSRRGREDSLEVVVKR